MDYVGEASVRPSAGERVRAFRTHASPGAQAVARSLSIAETLNLPLMRLLQAALVPSTGVPELAEIFVTGLLERRAGTGASPDTYSFRPGVREALSEGRTVLEEGIAHAATSEWLRRRVPALSETSLVALAADPRGRDSLDDAVRPFADLLGNLGEQLGLKVSPEFEEQPPVESDSAASSATAAQLGSSAGSAEGPPRVGVMFAREDRYYMRELRARAAALNLLPLTGAWLEFELDSNGDPAAAEIAAQLEFAQLVVILVSSDLLAADYVWGRKMTRVIHRHWAGQARVVPVLVRPTAWEDTPLAGLPAVPAERAIALSSNEEAGWLEVLTSLRENLEDVAALAPWLSWSRWPEPEGEVARLRLRQSSWAAQSLRGDARLVTVVPASGYARDIALHAGRELASQFTDGACSVDLSGAADEATIRSRVFAALLGARESRELLASSLDWLGDSRVLVLLDGVEAAKAAGVVASEILGNTTGTKVLVTAAGALGQVGERVVQLPRPEPVQVFVSYAHEDEPYLQQLRRQLKVLERRGLIDVWSDYDLQPGEQCRSVRRRVAAAE